MKEKVYDLEKRTFEFAKDVRLFTKEIKRTIESIEDIRQVVRSSGSVGANYIEANEKLSDKDFDFRTEICRKESKETIYWLMLIKETNDKIDVLACDKLINEADELNRIFSVIINNRNKK